MAGWLVPNKDLHAVESISRPNRGRKRPMRTVHASLWAAGAAGRHKRREKKGDTRQRSALPCERGKTGSISGRFRGGKMDALERGRFGGAVRSSVREQRPPACLVAGSSSKTSERFSWVLASRPPGQRDQISTDRTLGETISCCPRLSSGADLQPHPQRRG